MREILFHILRSALNETEPVKEQLTPDVLSALYSMSKRHDLAHIVSAVLYRGGLLTDDELSNRFRREELMSVARHEQMEYAYRQICSLFDDMGILYIPLKGAVIRPYYPEESMRTSCDIDILIREEDLDAAIKALMQKGYTCGERAYHDISLYSPRKIHLELHFSIQEKIDSLDAVLKDAWQYAHVVKEGQCEFSREFLLFHIFAHMSYHFLAGGCGIRSLMDIWIMEHKMGLSCEMAKGLLEKAGIYQFAKEISALADVCFSGKEKDDFSDTLLTYIVEGGVYGTQEKRVTNQKLESGNAVGFAWKRIFWPYRAMSELYPILKKVPILLPFFWVLRLLKGLFSNKRKRLMAEWKTANRVSNRELHAMQQIRDRLGL